MYAIILIFLAMIIVGLVKLCQTKEPIIEEEKPKEQEKITFNFKTLPHCLFYGPAGLGKTTLANVTQLECSKVYKMPTNFHIYTPSNLRTENDIVKLIERIQYGDFVFIDEIHGLEMAIEESLYSVMQDFKYFYNGQTINIPKFTLVGATTLAGRINKPLRDRFTILVELDLMKEEDLVKIDVTPPTSFETYQGQEPIKQLLKMHIFALTKDKVDKIEDNTAKLVAKRALGNPRIFKQYKMHIIAFQTIYGSTIKEQHLNELFTLLGVDEFGLDKSDRRVINYLYHSSKPVGESALATASGVSKDDLISIIEPKLEQLGFLTRTSRGRELSEKCRTTYRIF